jgi:hypothetical protein
MIIRIQKRADPFARMPKAILNDKRLSWRAKGILCYLLGKPNDWIVQRGDILNHATEGQKAVRAAFRELAQHGYAVLKNTNAGREWHISDSPQAAEKATCACDPKGNLPKSTTTKNEGSTKNDPPIVPQGGRRTDTKEASEWADRICKIFRRRLNTPWSAKEIKAFKIICPIDDDELCMVERYYTTASRGDKTWLRREVLTFLNNYRGEVDRARAWCECHPVRSHTLRAPISLHSEAPPVDPEAEKKFLADFKQRTGRLPYGYTENGENGQ